MSDKSERRGYLTLDGLRAVGAFMVVMRHVPWLFGPVAVPESFLAVDLFYLVSGFVIAHAYKARLARGGFFREFVLIRLIRLYPLYAFAMGLGLLAAILSVIVDPAGWWTWNRIEVAVAAGLFLFPMSPGMPSSGSSLDGPVWTLAPELLANFAYAALVRYLKRWMLWAIIAVFGALLILVETHYQSLDVGFGPTEFWAALVRVGFSFFAGVLVHETLDARFKVTNLGAFALLILLGLILGWRPGEAVKPWFELASVMIGFPALVVLAARYEPGPMVGRVFGFTGLMSYAIYLLHQPVGNLTRIALANLPWLEDIDVPDDISILPFGVLFCLVLLFIAWRLDKNYDAPLRGWLRRLLLKKKPVAPLS